MFSSFLDFIQHNQFFTGMAGAGVIGGILVYLRSMPHRLWAWLVWLCTVTMDIQNNDPAYDWILLWLAQTRYAQKRCRNLMAASIGSFDDNIDIDDDTKKQVPLVFSPAYGPHFFRSAGSWVILTRTRNEKSFPGHSLKLPEEITLRVLGRNRRALYAILDEAKNIANQEARSTVAVRVASRAHWSAQTRHPKRNPSSVILQTGIMEACLDDMQRFLGAETWYAERGIPYRRGYLYYGPPGCGKTSLVMAMASVFNRTLHIVSPSAIGDDAELLSLLMRASDNAMILLEDIDAAFKGREAKAKKEGVTFSGLLNAIDGISAPHGQIVIMTTNHRERLDPALIRPGRVDMQFHIDVADAAQVGRMCDRFKVPLTPTLVTDLTGKALAEIQIRLMELINERQIQ